MDKSAAGAYVYAKACGMYSRSFVGPRAKRLFESRRLQDLWSLLFKEDVPLVPEGLLALLLERKSGERVVNDFITLLSTYDRPDPLSRALLSLYDYNNLKAASAWAALGRTDQPALIDIGEFSLFDKSRWPDIAAMTRNSPVAWYNRVPDEGERIEWETRLDHQYYHSLWSALQNLDRQDRAATEDLVRTEIILQNVVWAMRLRVYYKKTADEIMPLLAGYDEAPDVSSQLCKPAMDVLERPLDSWGEWAHWKYAWLLNPHEEGVPWELDPRWAQLAADKYLYRRAIEQFHQTPFTVGVLVSFFKIKQLEEQMIRIAAEGLRLGATESQMNDFIGDGKDA